MGITVTINSKGLEAKLDKAKGEVSKKMMEELNRFGVLTEGDAKRLTPVDEGFLRNSISYEPATLQTLKTSVIVAANYGAFIEFGTRAFAAQYVASLPSNWQSYAATFRGSSGGSFDDFIVRIMGWMRRKGIDEKAAYPIAKKILRYGIRSKPFLFPAVRSNEIKLKERLKNL